jgi:hypothetical protein
LFEHDLRANASRLSREKAGFPLFLIMLQRQAKFICNVMKILRPDADDLVPFPCRLELLADISCRIAIPRQSLKFTGVL